MRKFPPSIRLGLLAGLVLVASDVHSAPITLPTDLVPFDQYRLVFVTDGSRNATNTSASFYNDIVSTEAANVTELNSLGTTWTAIVSTVDDGDAITNTNTDPSPAGNTGVPIYLVGSTDDGVNPVRIADHYDHLWTANTTSLFAAINRTSLGGLKLGDVWTGTAVNGRSAAPLGSSNVRHGDSAFTDTNWVNQSTAGSNNAKSFYAISDVLTVVPEPSSLHLFAGVGILTISCVWIRRRSHTSMTTPPIGMRSTI